jgi:hypothetical protein
LRKNDGASAGSRRSGHFLSEPIYVPDPAESRPDRDAGWLLVPVYEQRRAASSLAVLRVDALEDRPHRRHPPGGPRPLRVPRLLGRRHRRRLTRRRDRLDGRNRGVPSLMLLPSFLPGIRGAPVAAARPICCRPESLKNTNDPHGKTCTSPTSRPRPMSSTRAAWMSATTSCTWAEPGGTSVRPRPSAIEQADPGGVS